jgi:archaellum biogenesis protein FlaJ (TadC family)
MEKINLKDNYEYTQFCNYLSAQKSIKANRMLEKLKSLDQEDIEEYIQFKAKLQFNLLLQSFESIL